MTYFVAESLYLLVSLAHFSLGYNFKYWFHPIVFSLFQRLQRFTCLPFACLPFPLLSLWPLALLLNSSLLSWWSFYSSSMFLSKFSLESYLSRALYNFFSLLSSVSSFFPSLLEGVLGPFWIYNSRWFSKCLLEYIDLQERCRLTLFFCIMTVCQGRNFLNGSVFSVFQGRVAMTLWIC